METAGWLAEGSGLCRVLTLDRSGLNPRQRSSFQLWAYKILFHEPEAFEMQIACLHAFAHTHKLHNMNSQDDHLK